MVTVFWIIYKLLFTLTLNSNLTLCKPNATYNTSYVGSAIYKTGKNPFDGKSGINMIYIALPTSIVFIIIFVVSMCVYKRKCRKQQN